MTAGRTLRMSTRNDSSKASSTSWVTNSATHRCAGGAEGQYRSGGGDEAYHGADRFAEQETLRMLEFVMNELRVDPLVAAAIERGARARHQKV